MPRWSETDCTEWMTWAKEMVGVAGDVADQCQATLQPLVW